MPRGYSNNYEFVVNSSFQPYTFKELVQPFAIYKDAYEQTEAAYENLTNQSDKFKYLSETLPEGSKARQIYEGYANDLSKQAESLSKHGLTMLNRRGLTDMKRRYQGEIGRLVNADTALQEERKLRRTIGAKDNSMLYANENLNIDDFLDGGTPNLYGISGNELYTRGAAAGQAASKRVYSAGDNGSTLGGYYRQWVERNGYSKESMNAFRANASAIPELQQAADAILAERGVNDNLTGKNLERARQSVLNGIIDGAVYQEKITPTRDPGVMSAAEKEASNRAQQQLELSALQGGYKRENGKWVLDEEGLKKRAELLGINNYNPDDWEMGPDGKPRKKSKGGNSKTPEQIEQEKIKEEKSKNLLALDKKTLRNEDGFEVNAGKERHHYKYIAALAHDPEGKWYSGHLGEDYQGHRGIALWSNINVVDRLGNYSITRSGDKANRRVLAGNEIVALENNPEIANKIEDELIKANYYTEKTISGVMSEYGITREKAIKKLQENGYKYISDYQLVSVKNDEGEDDYLIAVRDK